MWLATEVWCENDKNRIDCKYISFGFGHYFLVTLVAIF